MSLKSKRITFRLDRYDQEALIKLKGWKYKWEVSEIIRNALKECVKLREKEEADRPKDLCTILDESRVPEQTPLIQHKRRGKRDPLIDGPVPAKKPINYAKEPVGRRGGAV